MKLLPCLICGSEVLHLTIWHSKVRATCNMECQGRLGRTIKDALNRWNKLNTPKKPRAARRSER